jgi:small subunit ribosomal protein S15
MYLTQEVKKNIFSEYGKSAIDTGSPESQVALFTHRIKHLTEHLKSNKKDLHTKRSLITLVGKRKKMLEYLKEQDIERYRALIKVLGLRK